MRQDVINACYEIRPEILLQECRQHAQTSARSPNGVMGLPPTWFLGILLSDFLEFGAVSSKNVLSVVWGLAWRRQDVSDHTSITPCGSRARKRRRYDNYAGVPYLAALVTYRGMTQVLAAQGLQT